MNPSVNPSLNLFISHPGRESEALSPIKVIISNVNTPPPRKVYCLPGTLYPAQSPYFLIPPEQPQLTWP